MALCGWTKLSWVSVWMNLETQTAVEFKVLLQPIVFWDSELQKSRLEPLVQP